MSRSLLSVICLSVCLLIAGCNGGSSDGMAVAIVDLDKVLKMTGIDLEINNAVQEREDQIRQGLVSFQQKLDEQWLAKKNEYGDEPTEEQQREQQQILNQLNSQIQQARSQASQNITNFQQQLFEGFQQQVSPVSLEVAKELGYSVVLGKNPSILAFDTTIDITDAVISRMKELKKSKSGGDVASPGTSVPSSEIPGMNPLPGAGTAAPGSAPMSITPPLKKPDVKPDTAPPTATPSPEPPAATQPAPEKTEAKPETPAESKPAPAETTKTPEAPATETPEPATPAAEKPAAETPAPEKPADPAPAADAPATEEKPAEN